MQTRYRSCRAARRSIIAAKRLITAAIAVAAFFTVDATAQTEATAVDAEERAAVVETIGRLLNEHYVFPEIAESCAEHLRAELGSGAFDDLSDPEAFAAAVTEALQSVSHDKHMRVRPRPGDRAAAEDEDPARANAMRLQRMREQNFGFERVERLDGNIGYLDLRYFAGVPQARPTATAAMNFLGNADALIFDMRSNGGGSPEMIRFLSSYLFDEPTHLNSLYWRQGDVTQEFWTLPEVPGPKLADVPVFVLTSDYTFSGAEEFSYNLRTRDRATLVGETTGGGANPGGVLPINPRFGVFVPTGRAINPVTGTNWEGTGVEPHVAVDADEALDRALELARPAAESHRTARAEREARRWADFSDAQARASNLESEGRHDRAATVLTDGLRDAHAAGLIGEMDVNVLGYQLLGRGQNALAIAAFRFNVEAYPESSNVHDSLGEAYMDAGRIDRAIESYQRSIELDPGNDNARTMIAEMRRKQGSETR